MLFQVEQTYKQYIKDTMKLFDATGPDALEYAAHLFHYESRIAEITPPDSVLNDPHASNNLISIGELSQIARSVSFCAHCWKGNTFVSKYKYVHLCSSYVPNHLCIHTGLNF